LPLHETFQTPSKSGSNLAKDTHSAAKRQIKMVKKPSVPTRGAENVEKPIFFNHLVTGVNRNPRKPASTTGRKGLRLPLGRRNRQTQTVRSQQRRTRD
jgi:hypothetical protein